MACEGNKIWSKTGLGLCHFHVLPAMDLVHRLTSRHLEFAIYTTGLINTALLTPKHELTNICLPSKDLPGPILLFF